MIRQHIDDHECSCNQFVAWFSPYHIIHFKLATPFTKASPCVVDSAPSFPSLLTTMESIGPSPCSCPHQTTSQQDMAAPNPREICPSRREMKRGKRGTYKHILSLSFQEEGRKVEGGEGKRVVVVHEARELSGPLLSDPL